MARNSTQYTSVDLNTSGTTIVFDASNNAQTVETVEMENTGSTADVQLEVTDGTSTVVLTRATSGGDHISYSNALPLDDGQSLQVNVTTVEGSALTGTVGVFARG